MFVTTVTVSRLYIGVAPKCQNLAYSTLLKQCLCQRSSHVKFFSITQRVRNFSNFRIFSLNRLSSTKKDTFGWSHYFRRILPTRLNSSKFSTKNEVAKPVTVNPIEINTNVKNNVMLYRYERPYLYKFATAFGIFSFVGCLTMVDLVYKILCKNLFNKNEDLKTRLVAHLLPIGAIAVGAISGPVIMFTVWYLVTRTVKYIILHKGGNLVTIVTYHPFKSGITRTVPLNMVSCGAERHTAKQYVPLKIQNNRFYYVIDKSGHFVNPELFDATCGSARNFS